MCADAKIIIKYPYLFIAKLHSSMYIPYSLLHHPLRITVGVGSISISTSRYSLLFFYLNPCDAFYDNI